MVYATFNRHPIGGDMPTVSPIQNEIDFQTHAERFKQGGRNVYSFTATLSEINNLLPNREPETETQVSQANRAITLSHAKDIQRYLQVTFEWLVSSILTYADPQYTKFTGYPEPDGTPNPDIGVLEILKTPTGEKALDIFDGQHRRRAIRDLMRSIDLTSDDPHVQDLATSKIPVLLYEENRIPKLQQMFIDHGKSKATEANTNTRFNQHNPFSLAAVALVENPQFKSSFFNDRVEMERTQVPRSSSSIIAINQLERAIKNLELGYTGRVSQKLLADYSNQGQQGLENLYNRCLEWADEFMPRARHEYQDLFNDMLSAPDIASHRTRSLAFNATVLQVLAACYHEWLKAHDDWRPLAAFIRQADFAPGKDANQQALLVDAGLVPPKGITPVPRTQEVAQAIKYIVAKAKEFSAASDTHDQPLLAESRQVTTVADPPEPLPTPNQETASAVDIAFQILAERNGETMHYKQLTQEVLSRNGEINGTDPARGLIARLVNDDRFVRPARKGFYGLKRDYPAATSVGRRKARTTRSRNAA